MKSNVPSQIKDLMDRRLHLQPNHPLCIVKERIQAVFPDFVMGDDLPAEVSVADCFDRLLIPQDHPSRSPSDTYYVDDNTVLRTHMTAHTVALASKGHSCFLTCGDVYRRDEIDRTHYPVFHQLDAFCVTSDAWIDLVKRMHAIAVALFPNVPCRVLHEGKNAGIYFPFTVRSIEVEVELDGQWIEILGGGVVHPDIMKSIGRTGEEAWAFGIGLERIAMAVWKIPDIRLFWSTDPRFLDQFSQDSTEPFKPFSTHPACYKDLSFWHDQAVHDNDLFEIVRGIAPDIIEQVKLTDTFVHPKTGRTSRCYRMMFRDLHRTLTNVEINEINDIIRDAVASRMNVELR